MSPEQAYEDTIEVITLQARPEYYTALAKVMEQYLVLNPGLNGDSRKRVQKGIQVFYNGDIDQSLLELTSLGIDRQNVPESLWDSMDKVRTEQLRQGSLNDLLDAMKPSYLPFQHYTNTWT